MCVYIYLCLREMLNQIWDVNEENNDDGDMWRFLSIVFCLLGMRMSSENDGDQIRWDLIFHA